jgi:sterol 3beta-glucosyltransferase
MKIALLTLGTRGDVQPYAVLGRALAERGHEINLSTGANFASLANDYGVKFTPVEADFQALINSEEGKAMMKNPFLARKHFKTKVQPMMIQALKVFFEVAKSSDYILYHVKSLGDFFADQFPEKMMRANVVPAIEATAEFPNPVFAALPLPRFLNRFTYKLADLGLAMMNNAIREFRISSSLSSSFSKRVDLPSVYGISPSFLPKPSDFPGNSYFTGFWQSHSSESLDPAIIDFLSSKKESVLVTFGSMPFETMFDLQQTLQTLSRKLNVNVLVVKGWGFENVSSYLESDSVKIISSAPFDKLFPKVSAVVFHGGIGTMAECLRAGVPFLACPVIHPMGDQYFWGKRAHDIGCSPLPIPLKKLTEESLIHNVSELLNAERYKRNCRRQADQLKAEHGLTNTIRIVESHCGQ